MPKLDDDTDFVMSTLWSRINSNDSIPMQHTEQPECEIVAF